MTQESIKTRVVGVDIRLERTTIAVVDVRGNVLSKNDFPTGDSPNVGDFVSSLSNNIINLVEANGGYETIRSVGIWGWLSHWVTMPMCVLWANTPTGWLMA